jgi:hypothetical protein
MGDFRKMTKYLLSRCIRLKGEDARRHLADTIMKKIDEQLIAERLPPFKEGSRQSCDACSRRSGDVCKANTRNCSFEETK